MKNKHGVIKNLARTCSCCPSQWEGITEKNEAIYIRYRWGRLTINLSKPSGTITDALNDGELIYSEQIGGEYEGTLWSEDLFKIIQKNNLFEL